MHVSVVIPCYNGGAFLEEAIQSVLAQSRAPDEVIVVNDCSTDDSASIARRLGIEVVHTPRNLGSAGARNLGLRTARGDLVAWLDADDVWEPEHLATVVPLLERHPAAVLAFARVRRFGAAVGEWPATLPEGHPVASLDACLAACPLPQNAVIVRREAVLAAGGYDETLRVAEDYDLWLRLALDHPFVCTHRVTVGWRQHPAQSSRAGLVPYWRQEYESRARLLQRIRATRSADLLQHVERESLRVWESHLTTAWYARRRAHVCFHLAMRPRVPGSLRSYLYWRVRAEMVRILPLWDRLRARQGPAASRAGA